MLRPRNSVIRQGGLRRHGGVHEVSKSGARQGTRRQTFAELDEYYDREESGDENEQATNQREGDGLSPDFPAPE